MKFRRTTAALVVAGSLAFVGGCGESKTASDVVEPSTTSSSPDPATTDGNEGGGSGQHLTAKTMLPALKAGMLSQKSAHITMTTTGAAALNATADMTIGGKQPSMDMTMDSALVGGKARIIVVDGVAYMSSPSLPKGKFMAIDSKDSTNPLADSIQSMTESASPESTFAAFDAGLEGVKYVGSDQVQGESTEHYQLTVNSAKAMQAQGQTLPSGLPDDLTYDVWIDQDNRMRRVTFELAGLVATIEISQWGKPVHIKAPPASKIVSG